MGDLGVVVAGLVGELGVEVDDVVRRARPADLGPRVMALERLPVGLGPGLLELVAERAQGALRLWLIQAVEQPCTAGRARAARRAAGETSEGESSPGNNRSARSLAGGPLDDGPGRQQAIDLLRRVAHLP